MSDEIAEYLNYANLQMAAESLFGIQPSAVAGETSTLMNQASLLLGNTRASKFTQTQADQFIADGWTVVEHKSNTATGFSGTLFRNSQTNELVMSFRSTEFADDAARDNEATNSLEIKEKGWAFGQIDDMREPKRNQRGQVLPFAPTPFNLAKWHALFALNSPALFTT